jgi:SAM-dependent methyltransferase
MLRVHLSHLALFGFVLRGAVLVVEDRQALGNFCGVLSKTSLIRPERGRLMPNTAERAIELSSTELHAPALNSAFRDCADILQCPITGEPLITVEDGWSSAGGQRHYPIDQDIPLLFAPVDPAITDHDVTEMVKAFYEETPFPNYDDIDSRETLIMKARQGKFAAALDEQLPDGAIVLEAGCGTGQLTNFLGLSWKRRVLGGDICLNSLRLANGFRERYRIANAAFLQMNLFRPPFRDNSIDVVISIGVLHHTGDARKGFETLVRKVKPGGYILIGLYNSYGRLPTLWRRRAFERFGPALYFLDHRLTSARMNEGRWQAWFRDQYRHPHETRHSIDEVLGWSDAAGVDFLSSIPAADGSPFTNDTRLFEPHPRATTTGRWATQLQMLLAGGRDGGLFIMIGRKHH